MEIRVKSIQTNKWSEWDRYPKCAEVFRPYLKRRGGIHTGLTREDEKRLGDIIGKDLRQGSQFWDEFKIVLGTETVILNTDFPEDEIKYLFLKGHKYVKPSISVIKPGARYYLHNADEEANVINDHNRVKRQAIKEFDKMKPIDWRKALRIYGDNASNVSDSVAEERLFARIEQNPQHFMRMWVENKNRNEEYIIKEGISKGVITKIKNTHNFGTILLGHSLEEAIGFLQNKENQDIKASIINEADIK